MLVYRMVCILTLSNTVLPWNKHSLMFTGTYSLVTGISSSHSGVNKVTTGSEKKNFSIVCSLLSGIEWQYII